MSNELVNNDDQALGLGIDDLKRAILKSLFGDVPLVGDDEDGEVLLEQNDHSPGECNESRLETEVKLGVCVDGLSKAQVHQLVSLIQAGITKVREEVVAKSKEMRTANDEQ